MIPRPLLLLLGAVAVVGVAWALLVPPWQAPDEASHFGYTQSLMERSQRPDRLPGRLFSTEQQLAEDRTDADLLPGNLEARFPWSEGVYRKWRDADREIGDAGRGNGGHAGIGGAQPNPAINNPPLYYAYSGVAYTAGSAGDVFDRLYLMRLWSMLLLAVSVVATWLLVGELIGPQRPLQLAAAGLVGLQPMASFIAASVNPDALLMASWAVVFWLSARALKRGLTLRGAIVLCAVTLAALLTKGTSLALVPGVAFVLGVGIAARRDQSTSRQLATGALAVAGLVALAATLAWIGAVPGSATLDEVTGSGDLDFAGLGSYLWQFYLPKLPSQEPFPLLLDIPAYERWIKLGWGAFGWQDVRLPGFVYLMLAGLTVGLLVAGAIGFVRARHSRNLVVGVFFALVALTLMAGLHWIDFRLAKDQGVPFNQGRYLLPLLPLLALCAVSALRLFSPRLLPMAVGTFLGGLVGLQLLSLSLVATRFYA
jgi:4-amino-4-deoxy-L-arabinose transferase-like glycosyltransferase